MDEPKFIIRAQDAISVEAIIHYQALALKYGLTKHASEVAKAILEFERWQHLNPGMTKMPFHKHIPVEE